MAIRASVLGLLAWPALPPGASALPSIDKSVSALPSREQLESCARAIASSQSSDLLTQTKILAEGCLRGCSNLSGYSSAEWPASPRFTSGACELVCAPAAHDQSVKAGQGEYWHQLGGACPPDYFALPPPAQPFNSAHLLVLARVSRLLQQAASSPDPWFVGAWSELQKELLGRQFSFPLPTRMSGRYVLPAAEAWQSLELNQALGIYILVESAGLRIGLSPTLLLTKKGMRFDHLPEGVFPGAPVTFAELATATARLERTLVDSINLFGSRFDLDLARARGPSSLSGIPSLDRGRKSFDLGSPLLLVDSSVPLAHVAEVVAALKDRGARLAVRALPDGNTAYHQIRLVAAKSAQCRLVNVPPKGAVLFTEPSSQPVVSPPATPSVALTPVLLEVKGSQPISAVMSALDGLVGKGLWMACVIARPSEPRSRQ